MSLQSLADEVVRLKRRCNEIPVMIKNLDTQLASSEKKLDSIKTQIKENEGRIRKCESAIQDARDQQGKYRTQLFKLKSNREYQALNTEIVALGEKISASETEIIEIMERNDNAQSMRTDAEKHLKEEKTRISLEKSRFESELKEEQRRLQEAESAYIEIRKSIEESIVMQFDKLVRKNGRAVSELHNKDCGNCFVKVRPQIAASVIGNSNLVNCDKCGVFLYMPEKLSE